MNWSGKAGLALGLAGLAFIWLQVPTAAVVRSSTEQLGEASLVLESTVLPNGFQQIVVLDSQAQSLAVYHVEPTQGKIQLKSVRNLSWDLRMEHFNGSQPLPADLRQVQP